MSKTLTLILAVGMLIGTVAAAGAAEPIPSHPKDLVYPKLDYKVPPADELRVVLSNGTVVFVAEDRMLPTFDLNIMVRTGGAFDPPGQAGLAALAGDQLRDGGTQNLTPEELDEEIDFLAASISTRIGDTSGSAGLSCLAKDIDAGLALLVDVLRYPRFDEERLRKAKERRLQNIKRRNDRSSAIEGLEWGFLLDGADHFSNRYPSSESINAITRDDMLAFHRKYFHPGNMIVTVAGDFDRQDMIAKLETIFGSWPVGERNNAKFPKPDHQPQAGVYAVNKQDVNQGRVSIGHKTIMRGSPDEFALRVMNGILGGTGFQSRLAKKVRSDEGLAYSVGSSFGQGVYYAGDFRCYFQSKSNACAYAVGLVLDEIDRLRSEKPSAEDVQSTISYFVESFPQAFPTKMALLGTYARDEYSGREPGYWQSYIEKLRQVTAEDVHRVAKKYLHPDQLVILAVGDADAILAGGHDKAPGLKLEKFGQVTVLPLRDPDTLKR